MYFDSAGSGRILIDTITIPLSYQSIYTLDVVTLFMVLSRQ